MDRRSFFRRSAGAAGAAVVAPVAAMLPGPSEDEQMRALVHDALAHPGKYPELEARAAEKLGEGFEKGLRAGLNASISSFYSVEHGGYATVAFAEGKYAARLDERPPRSA